MTQTMTIEFLETNRELLMDYIRDDDGLTQLTMDLDLIPCDDLADQVFEVLDADDGFRQELSEFFAAALKAISRANRKEEKRSE